MGRCCFRITWNGTDCGERKEPPIAPPKGGLHPKEVRSFMWWDLEEVLQKEFLVENQQVTGNRYRSPSDQLKGPPKGKSPEFVSRRHVSFRIR